ncbi:MaoC family dehydratase N-terminal domain-containing protein [Streptomyces sp. NPDC056453]|uniref:FAS1-like dehydratase domain-containing protein n=1 Tax=Streptomyces sp. NPDC056453 TaxID=3345822 RepID=UPI0036B32A46
MDVHAAHGPDAAPSRVTPTSLCTARCWHSPLHVGDLVTRRSEVTSVRSRQGGSGWLLLVTVRHDFVAGACSSAAGGAVRGVAGADSDCL